MAEIFDIDEKAKAILSEATGLPVSSSETLDLSDKDQIFTEQALDAARAGILAGMELAENMCFAERPIFNDPGEEFWKTPAEMGEAIKVARLEIERQAP